MQGYDETMRRMAVLLLSLAGLAERAAAGSAPVRFLVLLFLRPAAAVAAAHAARSVPFFLPDCPELPQGNTPGDALHLAAAFCALAAVFSALALETAPQAGMPTPRHADAAPGLPAARHSRPRAANRPRAPPSQGMSSPSPRSRQPVPGRRGRFFGNARPPPPRPRDCPRGRFGTPAQDIANTPSRPRA